MELMFTAHAIQRCTSREISEADVYRAVELGDVISCDCENFIVRYKRLYVVFSNKTGIIITVYRKKRNAAKTYMKRRRQEKAKHMLAYKHAKVF